MLAEVRVNKLVIDDRYRSAYRGTVLANWTGAQLVEVLSELCLTKWNYFLAEGSCTRFSHFSKDCCFGRTLYLYGIRRPVCISAICTETLLRLEPKQPVEKQLSPSPKCSPSSRDWGIGWFRVSGRNMVSAPDTSATTANRTVGTLGSKESCWRITLFYQNKTLLLVLKV